MIISTFKKYSWPLAILSAAIIIVTILMVTKQKRPSIEVNEKAWLVSVVAAKIIDQQPMIKLYGKIDSLFNSSLTAGVSAEVIKIHVNEGVSVHKGDLLLELDSREATLFLTQKQAELDEQEAKLVTEEIRHQANLAFIPEQAKRLSLAQSEVSRLQKLFKQKISAGSLLDKAKDFTQMQKIELVNLNKAVNEFTPRKLEIKARISRAQAIRDLAELELDRTKIMAPFDGKVQSIDVAIGRRVKLGETLVSLYDINSMIIRTQIPDRYLPQLNAYKGRLISELDDEIITADLLNLVAEVKTGQAGVGALFKITSPTDNLQKGRFIEASLMLPKQLKVVSIPFEALYDANKIYLIDQQNRLKSITVKNIGQFTDASGKTHFLIRSKNISENQKIMITQLPNAIDGLLVKVAK